MNLPELSVLIRIHDFSRVHLLCEAIFSVIIQSNVRVFPVVLCQRFTDSELEELKAILDPYRSLSDGRISVVNVDFGSGDIRSHLLNEGLRRRKTRYVSILDFDDVMYHDSYTTLISALQDNEKAAIAFGGIIWADCEDIGRTPYVRNKASLPRQGCVYDLFVDNFCPFHSFVVDTTRVAEEDLCFNENLGILEDYDFILRVSARYGADFSAIGRAVGEYRRRPNDTIREKAAIGAVPGAPREYECARRHIDQLKRELFVEVPVDEFTALRHHWSGLPYSASREEQLRHQIEILGSRTGRQLAATRALLRSFQLPTGLRWEFGYVDLVRREADEWVICGWVAAGVGETYPDEVFAMDTDGALTATRADMPREDTEKTVKVRDTGFELRLATQSDSPPIVFVVVDGRLRTLPSAHSQHHRIDSPSIRPRRSSILDWLTIKDKR